MCFCHSAIAIGAKVQVVRRKLLIFLFSLCVCSLCTGTCSPLCAADFNPSVCLSHSQGSRTRGESYCRFGDRRENLCFSLPRYSRPAVFYSWFLMVFFIHCILSLGANHCKRVLTGESRKNQPKRLHVHTMLGSVTCNIPFRFAFSSYLTHSNLCTVTPYGISYYSSSCVSAVT